MLSNKVYIAIFAIFGSMPLVPTTAATAQQEAVLHNFGSVSNDGYDSVPGLVFDGAGNLYGTTQLGGTLGGGTVFELMPNPSGGWTEKVLHNFGFNGGDGYYPIGGIVFDAFGNLYGTTLLGGPHRYGTVFELSPMGGGLWKENLLHGFGLNKDGQQPFAGLVLDSSGNLYGTTAAGGTYGGGSVFELMQTASGWAEKVLHNFSPNGTDGNQPESSLVFDASGNLYGTTVYGGPLGWGTVFQLTPAVTGPWTETLLHGFGNGKDGNQPVEAVTFDAAGNLYGAAIGGGDFGFGTVYELKPTLQGEWTELRLHDFGSARDGRTPYTTIAIDGDGNLFGTTSWGGSYFVGVLFELSPQADGSWTERLLHNFINNGIDAYNPNAGVILDTSSNLYGTSVAGGSHNSGTVFEFEP